MNALVIEEIEVALRDLEDELSDGLISEHAYHIRIQELQTLLAKEIN
jgi:hypothetical protein